MAGRSAPWVVLVLAVVQLVAAGLSGTGVLPGDDVGTISDRQDSALDPAGYAFAIWGLIYAASLVLAAFQAAGARRDDARLAGLRAPLALAFALNAAWIVLFQQEQFVPAHLVLIVLTAALAVGYARLAATGRPRSTAERWIVDATLGLYLGWATVATVAGTSTTLVGAGVTDLGLPTDAWAVLALVAAAVVVGAVTLRGLPEPGFPLATAWALVAIVVEQAEPWPVVAAVAAAAAVVPVAALVVRERRINRALGGAIAREPAAR